MEKRYADSCITILAQTNFRNDRRRFGIRRADRRAHMYVIGKTGTGKSTLIANLARQDSLSGEGFALLDPHGDLVEQVLRSVPEDRKSDLVYFQSPEQVGEPAPGVKFTPEEKEAGAAVGGAPAALPVSLPLAAA